MKKVIVILSIVLCVSVLLNILLMLKAKDDSESAVQHSESNEIIDTPQKVHTFRVKDVDGNVLIENGISASLGQWHDEVGGNNKWCVMVSFTDEHSTEFEKITEQYLGDKIQFYLDDELLSEPTVECVITYGNCIVKNDIETMEEAQKLVNMLNNK